MTFPHIKLKTTNFTVTPQVEELLEQKLEPLGKFIDDRVETLCEVELEKVAEHQSGKYFEQRLIYTSMENCFEPKLLKSKLSNQ